jgi:glycosyltransferase involved in cell wall biosynthesis
MISGLIVVATRIGGTPEVIMDGENGVLFMPNDPRELAKKIAQLVDDPECRNQMGYAGRQTILEQFTMTKMMDEIESYLQEVLQSSVHEKAGHIERA